MATSSVFVGRRIGHTNGLDRALPGHFAKKPSKFNRINPQSMPSLSCFRNRPSNFIKINPQSKPYKWAGLTPIEAIHHGSRLTRPKLARWHLRRNENMPHCRWKQTMMISEHLTIVNVKCAIIDYTFHNVLRFLGSLNICNLTAVFLCSSILHSIFVCVIIRQL